MYSVLYGLEWAILCKILHLHFDRSMLGNEDKKNVNDVLLLTFCNVKVRLFECNLETGEGS